MARESITPFGIKVLAKTVTGTRPGCDRFKRWSILLTMNGKTVKEYFAECLKQKVGAAGRNNVEDAVTKGLIELVAPVAPKEPKTKAKAA